MTTSPTHEVTYPGVERSPMIETDFPRLIRFEDYWGAANAAASTVSAKVTEGSIKATARRLSNEVDKIMVGLPYLIQALGETSDTHPFIGGVINAFKLVFNLEITRHDNDKKVKLLLLSMRNMATVFLHLRDVESGHVGADNRTIEQRLAELLPVIERDIFECANVCDTYSKKTHLVRVLQCTAWNEIMQRWVGGFSKYKSMVLDAVKMHTGTIDDVDSGVLDELMTKTDLILVFLEKAVPPEEHHLAAIIDQAGGLEVARGNPHVLELLLAAQRHYECATLSGSDIAGGPLLPDHWRTSRSADSHRQRRRVMIYSPPVAFSHSTAQSLPDLQILMQELQDTIPDAAIFTNFPNFKRKLQLVNIYRPGYLQVSPTMDAAQYETIDDPVLSEFWRETQWLHTVDATVFITSIHDHCQEIAKLAGGVITESGGTDGTWALGCIGPPQHQAIIEVLDPDATGLISIRKMNRFLSQRPEGWSLLQWLAYWGVGWQLACARYRRKICTLLVRMDALRASDNMRYSNQPSVQLYMNEASRRIYQMTASFQDDLEESALLPHFRRYIDAEESRIRLALERVDYDVSDLDTLTLVLGDQPYLERTLYLLLYLLLVRHHARFREATNHLLHPEELPDALSVMCLIHDAFQLRCEELNALYSKRFSDPLQRVMRFACSMFALSCRPPSSQSHPPPLAWTPGPAIATWSLESTTRGEDISEDSALTDELLRQAFSSSPTNVLKYPPHREVFYSCSQYNKTEEDIAVTDGRLLRILGRWTMLVTREADVDGTRVSCRTVYIVDFHSRPGGDRFNFTGISHLDYAWPSVGASFIGRCVGDDDWECGLPTYYTFTKTFDGPTPPEFYQVRMDSDGRTLIGVRDSDFRFCSPNKAWVIMKKDIAPEVMVYYPSREELIADRTSALKHFMLSAVWHQVRQRCRPMLFAHRQMKRMARLLYLTGKKSISALTTIEKMEDIYLTNTLVPADLYFLSYKSLEPKNTQLTRDLRRPTGTPSHNALVSPRVGIMLIQWLVPEHRRRVRFDLPGVHRTRDPSLLLETTGISTFGVVPPAARSLLFSGDDGIPVIPPVTPVIPPVIPPKPDSPMWQDHRWDHDSVFKEREFIVIHPRTRTPSQWSTSMFSSEQSDLPAHGGERFGHGRSSTPLEPKTEPSHTSQTLSGPWLNGSGVRPRARFPEPRILPAPVPPPFVSPPNIVPPVPTPSSPSDSPSPAVIPGRDEDDIIVLPPGYLPANEQDGLRPMAEHPRDFVEGRGDIMTVHAIQVVLGMFFVFFVACLSIVCLFVYYSGGSLTISLERKGREL
ncbi:hypothetical protein LXA43DRAFT_7935 [Ganoderma leucocontextum]|nr:hypothetical protein LXA43DRAFT_7935 [Ganoderma leucocontextum]